MNTCVSDNQVIVNIQGIRYVNWGKTSTAYIRDSGRYFVTVTYKSNHQTFYYQTESDARALFNKIREAMDKTYANNNSPE